MHTVYALIHNQYLKILINDVFLAFGEYLDFLENKNILNNYLQQFFFILSSIKF